MRPLIRAGKCTYVLICGFSSAHSNIVTLNRCSPVIHRYKDDRLSHLYRTLDHGTPVDTNQSLVILRELGQ